MGLAGVRGLNRFLKPFVDLLRKWKDVRCNYLSELKRMGIERTQFGGRFAILIGAARHFVLGSHAVEIARP